MGRKRINYALLNSEDPTSTADGKQPASGEYGYGYLLAEVGYVS